MENSNFTNLLQKLTESFTQTTSIKKVYGEPINTHGKTIITVAKVAQGFGGGFGGKNGASGTTAEGGKPKLSGEGGGMGGGLAVKPVGVLEITDAYTRFIRFDSSRHLLLGAALGVAVSMLWFRGRKLNLKAAGGENYKQDKKDKKKRKK